MMNKPKAFSYLRFSTQNQIKGDSSRRQTEAAQAYAERHGLDLDDELTFRDLGVSAFRGANIVEGALGKFLEAVDSGKVQPGSYLLVENLDRLSRDKIMPALNRFSSLLEKGITVVTLSDGKCYDADSLNNLPDLMLSLLVMSRANEESELKSLRGKAAWKKKRERAAKEGQPLTAKAPAWLQLRDGEFKVIKDRAAVVQRIFHMALDGHGKEGIAYRLNKERVKPFGEKSNGWYPSYVRNILANEAVIGRFQPMRDAWVGGKRRHEPDGDVIEGYYPAILDPEIFYRARRAPRTCANTPVYRFQRTVYRDILTNPDATVYSFSMNDDNLVIEVDTTIDRTNFIGTGATLHGNSTVYRRNISNPLLNFDSDAPVNPGNVPYFRCVCGG